MRNITQILTGFTRKQLKLLLKIGFCSCTSHITAEFPKGAPQSPVINSPKGTSQSNSPKGAPQSPVINSPKGAPQSNSPKGASQSPVINSPRGGPQLPMLNFPKGTPQSNSPKGTPQSPVINSPNSAPDDTSFKSESPNRSSLVPSFGVCTGQTAPDNDVITHHVPTRQEIVRQTDKLKKILSYLPQPKHVTVCRSFRDGYTPKEFFSQIERNILTSIQNSFHSYRTVHYDVNLLGGPEGWFSRNNSLYTDD